MKCLINRFLALLVVSLLLFGLVTPQAHAIFSGANGKILYYKHIDGSYYQVYMANPDGSDEQLLPGPAHIAAPLFSPDGQHIAFQGQWPTGEPNISIMDLQGNVSMQSGYFTTPLSWSSDGLSVYGHSCSTFGCSLYEQNIDGSNMHTVLSTGPGAISPDGSHFITIQNDSDNRPTILSYVADIASAKPQNSSSPPTAPAQTIYTDPSYNGIWCTTWSPDSTRVATWSQDGTTFSQRKLKIFDVRTKSEVYEYLFAGFPRCPVWSPDGKSLMFGADKDTRVDLLGQYSDYAMIRLDLASGTETRVMDNVWDVLDWQPITNTKLYRLANWRTHERLFTSNPYEVLTAQKNDPGWVYENVAMKVYTDPSSGRVPVYRMANWMTHERLFTQDYNEVQYALTHYGGWVNEGIAFYASTDTSNTPVYRMANWMTHERLFTTDSHERDTIKDKDGWVYEGTAFYAAP